ncbi:MAG: hypothetical protein AAGI88_14310 [Pseudomonadota bacterium]
MIKKAFAAAAILALLLVPTERAVSQQKSSDSPVRCGETLEPLSRQLAAYLQPASRDKSRTQAPRHTDKASPLPDNPPRAQVLAMLVELETLRAHLDCLGLEADPED